mmetsp:Transcript_48000/g.148390  ORF Transcript_48000/g.148390 Transcript_48000/m.148390 type:complete len:244 (-) Transcript_48000:190-921(-)
MAYTWRSAAAGLRTPAEMHGKHLGAWSAHLGLVLHSLGGRLDLLHVTEVAAKLQGCHGEVAGDGLELGRHAVDQWSPSGDLEARDGVFRNVLDEFENGTNGVPMCRNEDRLAGLERGGDFRLPEGHHALNRVLQALSRGDLFLLEVYILGVLAGVVLAILLNRRWRHVKAAAPDLNLLCAVLLHGLLLVEAGEPSVHPLVQAPRLVDGHVELVGLLEGVVAGLDRTLEDRREADVELEALLLD